MNSSILPIATLTARVRAFRLAVSTVFAIALAAGVLLPGMSVHAQSGWPKLIAIDEKQPQAEATPEKVKENDEPMFTLTGGAFRMPAEHSTAAGAIPAVSEHGYSGTINFKCELTTKTDTEYPPLCAMDPASVKLTAGGKEYTEVLIFGKGTKLPPGVEESRNVPSAGSLFGAGGAVLACGLLFVVPARRRAWRAILSAVLLLSTVAGVSACSNTNKMITAGDYNFKITGTDSQDPSKTASVDLFVEVL
jgi:hypothetical protein